MRRLVILIAVLGVVALGTGPAAAYNAPGPRWPGSTIRYSESMPKSWNWAIRQAVKTWNTSGARVRFVKVPRSRAQVRIRYGDANGAGGYASIGRQPGAYVEMSNRFYKPLRSDGQLFAAQVLAHELGHVIGLDHVPGRCRLMTPTVLDDCPDPPKPWLYDCSWLSKDDLRGAIKLYGGKARKPARKWCSLEPEPAAPRDVQFLSGDPVTILWVPPKGVPKESVVSVEVFPEARCRGERDGLPLDIAFEDAKAGRWSDYDYREPGTYCYEVHLETPSGRPSPVVRGTASSAPAAPAAPVVLSLTEYPDELSDYAVEVELPEGTDLHVDASAAGQCTTTPQPGSLADEIGVNTWVLWPVPEGPVCLSFFAIGRVSSAPTTIEVVHGPRPVFP